MAKTTFEGPVVSLKGYVAGSDPNASDTQQGGTNPYTVTNVTSITNGTFVIDATTSEGTLFYVNNGANGSATLCFSDGTTWLRADTNANVSTS